jgi:hypothetical protein
VRPGRRRRRGGDHDGTLAGLKGEAALELEAALEMDEHERRNEWSALEQAHEWRYVGGEWMNSYEWSTRFVKALAVAVAAAATAVTHKHNAAVEVNKNASGWGWRVSVNERTHGNTHDGMDAREHMKCNAHQWQYSMLTKQVCKR